MKLCFLSIVLLATFQFGCQKKDEASHPAGSKNVPAPQTEVAPVSKNETKDNAPFSAGSLEAGNSNRMEPVTTVKENEVNDVRWPVNASDSIPEEVLKYSKACGKLTSKAPFRDAFCKISKDKQRLLALSPQLTTCGSSKDSKELIWVFTEFDVKNESLIRSTTLCDLNMGSVVPVEQNYEVYSFGEKEDGRIWMAYRQVSKYVEDMIRPGKPFQIVQFMPNGENTFHLEKLHELDSYSSFHRTPYGLGLFTHSPSFVYVESRKEFLFYSLQEEPRQVRFLDMNYQETFELPRTYFMNQVYFSISGNLGVYNYYTAPYNKGRDRSFGIFDFKTGKSIYEYPGEKLDDARARFLEGSEKYVYFNGFSRTTGPAGAWVAFIVDIESGETISVPVQ